MTDDHSGNRGKYDFTEGFMFALNLLSSIGQVPDFDDMVARLFAVARGELSLMSTPEEAIQEIERDAGRPLPERLKQTIRRALSHRSRPDTFHRGAATIVLREMGYAGDEILGG